jgi:hypothetical protein
MPLYRSYTKLRREGEQVHEVEPPDKYTLALVLLAPTVNTVLP